MKNFMGLTVEPALDLPSAVQATKRTGSEKT